MWENKSKFFRFLVKVFVGCVDLEFVCVVVLFFCFCLCWCFGCYFGCSWRCLLILFEKDLFLRIERIGATVPSGGIAVVWDGIATVFFKGTKLTLNSYFVPGENENSKEDHDFFLKLRGANPQIPNRLHFRF